LQSVPLDQPQELPHLVRLRLPPGVLQVHELAHLGMDEDVMAPARPPQLEAERLHEPAHVGEGVVREIAAREPGKQPPWIH
jgi:hypothetical protein